MLRFGQRTQRLAARQADAHFTGAVGDVQDLLDLPVQVIVFGAGHLCDVDQLQPARFDQRHRRAIDRQFQVLGAVVGDLRLQGQATGQLKVNQIVVTMPVDGNHGTVQLVTGAGTQHQAAEQVEIPGVFGGVQHLSL